MMDACPKDKGGSLGLVQSSDKTMGTRFWNCRIESEKRLRKGLDRGEVRQEAPPVKKRILG
jgi:hypothetical protein